MVKERPYQSWSLNRLKKHRNLIEKELYLRELERGGQDEKTFRTLHSQPDCSIATEHIRTQGSGFYSPVEDYQAPLFVFRYKCADHNVVSREFSSMTWIEEAEMSLENEYQRAKNHIIELRETLGNNYTTDYFVWVEKRAIQAELVAPQESLYNQPQ